MRRNLTLRETFRPRGQFHQRTGIFPMRIGIGSFTYKYPHFRRNVFQRRDTYPKTCIERIMYSSRRNILKMSSYEV
jgi:hypothetical protein